MVENEELHEKDIPVEDKSDASSDSNSELEAEESKETNDSKEDHIAMSTDEVYVFHIFVYNCLRVYIVC